jgi:outer membrane lipoprotein
LLIGAGPGKKARNLSLVVILTLLGCAAQVPPEIRTPEPAPVSVSAARAAPHRYAGTAVRWGGSIISVRNDATTTAIELLARHLDATGEPRMQERPATAGELGRFIARFDGFLDPAAYPAGRLLTVTGTVDGVETRKVGEYAYRYPVLRATGRHLWPEPAAQPLSYPGPWPDPWYGWPGWGAWYGPGYGRGYRPWYW